MADTETVSLNFDGSFAPAAQAAAGAAERLGGALDKVAAASSKAKSPPIFTEADRFRVLEAGAKRAAEAMDKLRAASAKQASADRAAAGANFGGRTPASLLASANAKPPSGFNQIVQAAGKIFGPGAASALTGGAAKLVQAEEKLAPFGLSLSMGASALSSAAGVAGSAGAAIIKGAALLAAAAAAVTIGALKFGVDQSAERQKQQAIFGALGSGKGYDVAIKLAGQYGIDSDTAIHQVKGLLGAKFKEEEIPAIVRIAVGIGAVRGEEKAKAFLEKLETQSNKGGKASEETIKGFAEAGVDADKVYAALAKRLGVDVKTAQAKVKAGTVDMKVALDAVKNAASTQFGGVADKLGDGVFALVNRIKLAFAKLFSGFNLEPLKNVLKNIAGALEGPGGQKIFAAVSKLGSTILKVLFGPLEGPNGAKSAEAILTKVASGISRFASAVERYGPPIMELVGNMVTLTGMVLELVAAFSQLDVGMRKLDDTASTLSSTIGAMTTALQPLGPGAADAGNAFVDGFVGQLEDGIGRAVAAASAMGAGALGALKGVLGIASPSKAAAWAGNMFGQGFAQGAENDNGVSDAGKSIAGKAMGGLGAGAAGGAKGATGGGGSGVTIIVQVTVPQGADAQAFGQAVGDAAYREFQKHERRSARERAA